MIGRSDDWGRARITVTALFFVTMLVHGSEAAESPRFNIAPKNPSLRWTVNVVAECKKPICTSLTQAVLAQHTTKPSMCLVDDDLLTQLGASFPVWTVEDYRAHLDEIKSSVLGSFLGNTAVMQHLQQSVPGASLQQLRDILWSKDGPAILALFAGGRAHYETTKFDVDSDGQAEQLYRVSVIDWDEHTQSHWMVRVCSNAKPTPQYHVHLKIPPNTQSANTYETKLADTLETLSAEEYLNWHGTSLFLGVSEGSASISELRKSGSGQNRFPRDQMWWLAVFVDDRR